VVIDDSSVNCLSDFLRGSYWERVLLHIRCQSGVSYVRSASEPFAIPDFEPGRVL